MISWYLIFPKTVDSRVRIGLEQKVDLRRVNLDALKPWIADKVSRLLNSQDYVKVRIALPTVFGRFEGTSRCSDRLLLQTT